MASQDTGVDPSAFAIGAMGLLVARTFGVAVPILADGSTRSTIEIIRLMAGAALLPLALFMIRYIRRPGLGTVLASAGDVR